MVFQIFFLTYMQISGNKQKIPPAHLSILLYKWADFFHPTHLFGPSHLFGTSEQCLVSYTGPWLMNFFRSGKHPKEPNRVAFFALKSKSWITRYISKTEKNLMYNFQDLKVRMYNYTKKKAILHQQFGKIGVLINLSFKN